MQKLKSSKLIKQTVRILALKDVSGGIIVVDTVGAPPAAPPPALTTTS